MIKPDGTAETLGTGPAWCGTKAEFEPVSDRLLVQRAIAACCSSTASRPSNLATDGYHVSRLAVSPDGSRIAAAMGDRTVRLWDAQGKVLSVLRGHTDLVHGRRVFARRHAARVGELRQDDPDLGARDRPLPRAARPFTRAIARVFWRGPNELVTGVVGRHAADLAGADDAGADAARWARARTRARSPVNGHATPGCPPIKLQMPDVQVFAEARAADQAKTRDIPMTRSL